MNILGCIDIHYVVNISADSQNSLKLKTYRNFWSLIFFYFFILVWIPGILKQIIKLDYSMYHQDIYYIDKKYMRDLYFLQESKFEI